MATYGRSGKRTSYGRKSKAGTNAPFKSVITKKISKDTQKISVKAGGNFLNNSRNAKDSPMAKAKAAKAKTKGGKKSKANAKQPSRDC